MRDLSTRIFVKGGYGLFNFGDDCLMIACHEMLKRSLTPSDFVFWGTSSTYPSILAPDICMVDRNTMPNINCELLVYGGGTQFYAFNQTVAKRLSKVWHAFVNPVSTIERKILKSPSITGQSIFSRKSAAIGVGFGPFVAGSKSLVRTRDAAKSFDFLSVRDTDSFALCRQWDIKHAQLNADLCYWPFLKTVFGYNRRMECGRIRHVGLIVRDWNQDKVGDAYNKQIFEVAEHLKKRNIETTFVLFAGQTEKKWLDRIGSRFQTIQWDPLTQSIPEFLGYLNEFDMLITARYHGVVFGSLLELPMICIGIEPKLVLAAQALGIEEYIWQFPYEVKACISLIDKVGDRSNEIKNTLNEATRRLSGKAQDMISNFERFLNELNMIQEETA